MTTEPPRHVVTVEDAPDQVERRSIVVDAPAEVVFDILADPSRHCEIDGSGSVKSSRVSTPERLELGARFGMDMRIGVPYRITNEVVEFVENETIAWRHVGGHIWRYQLEHIDGGCRVTEEFDWRPAKSHTFLRVTRAPRRNAESIEKTLERIAALVDDPAEH